MIIGAIFFGAPIVITDLPTENLLYFTLRALVSAEETNAFGKNSDRCQVFGASLQKALASTSDPLDIFNSIFINCSEIFRSTSADVNKKYDNFKKFLIANYNTMDRLQLLQLIFCEVMPTLNLAVEKIPTTEAMQLAQSEARNILSEKGDAALEYIINEWDDVTLKACLIQENNLARSTATKFLQNLDLTKYGLENLRYSIVVSALQEFERRAGQKRKSRSGDDLHHAVLTILDYLNIVHDPVPSLISGVIEADLSIKHGGYYTLISCKRTGRERVKQATTDVNELQRLRVRRMIWFFTHFDQSRNRVLDMGVRGNIFYLPDSSNSYITLSTDSELQKYVFPISKIRETLPLIVRGTL